MLVLDVIMNERPLADYLPGQKDLLEVDGKDAILPFNHAEMLRPIILRWFLEPEQCMQAFMSLCIRFM